MEQRAPLRTSAFSAEAAWQLLRLHRPELALELADRLLAREPASVAALLARTEALRQLRQLPEAAVTATAAITAAPQSAAPFAALAQVRGQQGELAKAENLLQEALRLNPENAGHYGLLAQLQYLQKRPGEALTAATAGLRVNARHADCLLWRALAQEEVAQPTEADTDFAHVLQVAPNSALVHEWRGRLLLQRHEPHAAGTHLAEALRLAPGNTAVLLLLRQAYREQLWPRWLLHQRQRQVQDQLAGRLFNWRSLVIGPFVPFCAISSWWRTRKQPLFRERIPGLRRATLRKSLVLVTLVASPLAFIYAFVAFKLPPFTLVILVVSVLRAVMNLNEQSASAKR